MSNPFTSVNRSERHLQTDDSQGPEYLCRDHDGLEGRLMSGATSQISEGDRGYAPNREPSIGTFDPLGTVASCGSTVGNALVSGHRVPAAGRLDPATSSRTIDQEIGTPVTGFEVEPP